MLTDNDLASIFLRRNSTSAGRLPVVDGGALGEAPALVRPISPFLPGLPSLLACCGICWTVVRGVLGVPGDVGGRARGAELIECAFRLCAWEWEMARDGPGSGERVFVNVIVTEKGSPAK